MADKNEGAAWGYKDGKAQLFEDGKLPAGWSDTPAKPAEKPKRKTKAK